MVCYRKILVPIDGSEISARGVEEALRLARDQQAEVRFIYVVDESVIRYDYSCMADIGELIEIQRKSGRQATEKAQQRATELGVKSDAVVRENVSGRVSDKIIEEAGNWRSDLIVMGTHGRRGIDHFVLGSTAEAVLRTSPVPVLLLRPPVQSRAMGR